MAVLKIDNTDTSNASSVSFLSDDYQIVTDGFESMSLDEPTWLNFNIIATGSADSVIRSNQITVDRLFEQARMISNDPNESDTVLITWASEGESNKRAIVKDGRTQIVATKDRLGPLLGKGGAFLRLAVLVQPTWEKISTISASIGNRSPDAGTFDISASSMTEPWRIETTRIINSTAGAAQTFTRLWLGIRDIRKGTTGYVPNWDARYGDMGTDATIVADANSRSGSAVQISFSSNSGFISRFGIDWDDIATACSISTASYSGIIGRYLVLGRVKLDAATTQIRCELRSGWSGNADLQDVGPVVYLDGSTMATGAFTLRELGEISIPPYGNRDDRHTTACEIGFYRLTFWAERLSAGGTLTVDELILMPNEHLFTAGNMTFGGASQMPLIAVTTPEDYYYSYHKDSSNGKNGNNEYTFLNWELPVRSGICVFAALGSASIHGLVNALSASLTFRPRYKTFVTT